MIRIILLTVGVVALSAAYDCDFCRTVPGAAKSCQTYYIDAQNGLFEPSIIFRCYTANCVEVEVDNIDGLNISTCHSERCSKGMCSVCVNCAECVDCRSLSEACQDNTTTDGTKCDWYDSCLMQVYDVCEEAESFLSLKDLCNTFVTNDFLTNYAAFWSELSNKCIQKTIAPSLLEYEDTSCEEQYKIITDSVESCFIQPSEEEDVSICKLCYEIYTTLSVLDQFLKPLFWNSVKTSTEPGAICHSDLLTCVDPLNGTIFKNTLIDKYNLRYLKFTFDATTDSDVPTRPASDCEEYCLVSFSVNNLIDQMKYLLPRDHEVGHFLIVSASSPGIYEADIIMGDNSLISTHAPRGEDYRDYLTSTSTSTTTTEATGTGNTSHPTTPQTPELKETNLQKFADTLFRSANSTRRLGSVGNVILDIASMSYCGDFQCSDDVSDTLTFEIIREQTGNAALSSPVSFSFVLFTTLITHFISYY